MRFLLACEGQSDTGLVSHIERMIIESSDEAEVEGEHWCHGSPLERKIRNALRSAGNMVDMLFVHRDANSAGADARRAEVDAAVAAIANAPRTVAVVPVRMTEAWLLLDEAAIRKAVGNPSGRAPLALPTPREAERRNAKQTLADAFLAASEATGRPKKAVQRDFGRLRRQLLVNLPIGGPLERLPSWTRFREDTLCAIGR